MNDVDIKLFYNPYYDAYKCPCYLLYIKDNGLFIETESDIFEALYNYKEKVNNDNINEFINSRQFSEILNTSKLYHKINWNSEFDTYEKKQIIKEYLEKIKAHIMKYRYDLIHSKQRLYAYLVINRLISDIHDGC